VRELWGMSEMSEMRENEREEGEWVN